MAVCPRQRVFARSRIETGRSVIPLLRTLFAERQTTALYVTHESREAVAFDARIAVLQRGRIVADGLPAELAVTPPTPFVRALFAESTPGK